MRCYVGVRFVLCLWVGSLLLGPNHAHAGQKEDAFKRFVRLLKQDRPKKEDIPFLKKHVPTFGARLVPLLPEIFQSFKSKDRMKRELAGFVLMNLSQKHWSKAWPMFEQVLKSPKHEAWALSFLERSSIEGHFKKLFPDVLLLLKHPSAKVRVTMIRILVRSYPQRIPLGKVGRKTSDILLEALKDKNASVRIFAAQWWVGRAKDVKRHPSLLLSLYQRYHTDSAFLATLKRTMMEHQATFRPIFEKMAKSLTALRKMTSKSQSLQGKLLRHFQNPASLASGKKLYRTYCAVCHKPNGAGFVGPNLTDLYSIHGLTLKKLYEVTSKGVSGFGMPGYKGILKTKQLLHVTAYVAALKKHPLKGRAPSKRAKKRPVPAYLKSSISKPSSTQ